MICDSREKQRKAFTAEQKTKPSKTFFFLKNCCNSVVASVVLPQLLQSPLSPFFFVPFGRGISLCPNERVCVHLAVHGLG